MSTEDKKTLTPQILALYLGCKVEIDFGNGTREIGTLLGVSYQIVDVRIPGVLAQTFRFALAKPILRPLSSMTDEEAVEMYNELFPNAGLEDTQKATTIQKQINENGIYIEASVSILDYVKWFPYLLSKGFDLFGLIDSGLAITQPK